MFPRLQHFWTVVGCSVYVGSGPPLSLVDLRVDGLRLVKQQTQQTKQANTHNTNKHKHRPLSIKTNNTYNM